MHSFSLSTPCFINTSLASLQSAGNIVLKHRSLPNRLHNSSSNLLPGSSLSTQIINFLTESSRSSFKKLNFVSKVFEFAEGAPSGTLIAFLYPATSKLNASISPSVMIVSSSFISSHLYKIFSAPAT